MKICTCCGVSKPLESFSVDRAKPDGLRTKCRECTSVQRKISRVTNAENIAKQKAAYAKANREHLRDYHKRWRDENKDELNARTRAYRAENREKLYASAKRRASMIPQVIGPQKRAIDAKLKAKELGCIPGWANFEQIKLAYAAADLLMQVTGEWYEVDHIVPMQGRTVCGLHCESNLQVLTRQQNRAKGISHWPDMPK